MSEKIICSKELELIEEIMPSNDKCPNVLAAKEEQEALDKYYHQAKLLAQTNGKGETIQSLEQAIKENSCAVINLKPNALYNIVHHNQRFKNYYETKLLEPNKTDLEREEIDESLFGDHKKNIRYAALSLDGWGLSAYGICTICLRESDMQNRASLLKQNSFTFFEEHPPLSNSFYPPPGYRSTWQERHKLAVVKLINKIEPNMKKQQFIRLLLEDKKNKKADEFIEVHIYGELTKETIEFAGIVSEATDEDDILRLAIIEKKLGSDKWKGTKPK